MNKTQETSKRVKIILLILFELNAVSVGVVQYMLKSGGIVALDKPDNYPSLLTIYILLSLFYVILAWFMERIFEFLAARAKRQSRLFTSQIWRLILTYMCIFCPTLFGEILLDVGLPISQFAYFLAVTIVTALIWGIYDLQKGFASETVQR